MRGSSSSTRDDVVVHVPERDQGRRHSHRSGQDPIRRILVMEDHDQAYYAWKAAGFRDRLLVHLDAHLDFNWIADWDPVALLQTQSVNELERLLAEDPRWNLTRRPKEALIHIGNYLYPSLTEGLVRSVFWIVPDQVMESRKQRHDLVELFKKKQRKHPSRVQLLGWHDDRFQAMLCDKPVTVCRLRDLPDIQEPVLLNIDTDYLVIPSFREPYPHAHPRTVAPWIWPDELVARLKEKHVSTDFVTIAYSVHGGFTPLSLKFLGDDLARRLNGHELPEQAREVIRYKREATKARQNGKLDEAIKAFEQELDLKSEDPSIHYGLAELFYEKGWAKQAAQSYRRATALDPSYRLTEQHLSPVYRIWGLRKKVKEAYERMLALDPTNADAHAGLGGLFVQQGDWNRAKCHYQKARECDPQNPRLHYELGCLHAACRQWDEAEAALKQALGSQRFAGLASFWLGYVYAKTKRHGEALAAYEAAFHLGLHNPPLHWRLGGLYLRHGRHYRALRQYSRALRMLPAVPLVWARRLLRRIHNLVRHTFDGVCR